MIDKQKFLNKKYNLPFDFIVDYIKVYNEQINTPFKVFLEDITYFKIYEQSLLNYLVNLSTVKKIDINEYSKLENILIDMKCLEFYDNNFYEITKLNFIKSIAIMIDKVDLEILKFNFDNIRCLFVYTDCKLNLYNLFTEKLINLNIYNTDFWEMFTIIKKHMNYINNEIKNVELSQYVNEDELSKRISISLKLLGDKKIIEYKIEGLLNEMLIFFKNCELPKNEKYCLITEFCSNYIIKEHGQEKDLHEFVRYSKTLIN